MNEGFCCVLDVNEMVYVVSVRQTKRKKLRSAAEAILF
jgi:hypothetical protein